MDVTKLITQDNFKEEIEKQDHWDRAYMRLEEKNFANKEEIMEDLKDFVDGERKQLIIEQVLNGTYEWVIPEKVAIAKAGTTKKRIVYMYPPKERLILGVIYRVLNVLCETAIEDNCFSYKRGVTTHSAILYIQKYKKNSDMHGLKLDISSYFNSVSKPHLTNCINELFGNAEGLHKTMSNIMLNDIVMYRGKEIEEYKSLIAGCPLGSFFANYCLREVDKYFKDSDIIYARYSDDIILMDKDKDKINGYLEKIKEHIGSYGLTINPKKYEHFEPEDAVEYLGLSLKGTTIDISNHAKQKMKRQIKRWVKKGRKEIEMTGASYEKIASNIVSRLNSKLYKCYIFDKSKFGWGLYVFRFINTTDSLVEIDYYLRDQLRYLKTGKYNKHNVRAVTEMDFKRLGVVKLYDMYKLYREDFDYYCERVYNL